MAAWSAWIPGDRTRSLSSTAGRPCDVVELHALVDRVAALPPLSTYGDGTSGDHAWLTIIDRGFVLHAYFGERHLSFEIYGPKPPGTERHHSDPYDGTGLAGTMTAACLKDVLVRLDAGESPIPYLRENAADVQAIED